MFPPFFSPPSIKTKILEVFFLFCFSRHHHQISCVAGTPQLHQQHLCGQQHGRAAGSLLRWQCSTYLLCSSPFQPHHASASRHAMTSCSRAGFPSGGGHCAPITSMNRELKRDDLPYRCGSSCFSAPPSGGRSATPWMSSWW